MEISQTSQFKSVAGKVASGQYMKSFIQNSPQIQSICQIIATGSVTAYNVVFDLVRQITELKIQHDADQVQLREARQAQQMLLSQPYPTLEDQLQKSYGEFAYKLQQSEYEKAVIQARSGAEIKDLNRIIAAQAKQIEELKFLGHSFKVQGNSIKQMLLDCYIPVDDNNYTGALSSLVKKYLDGYEELQKYYQYLQAYIANAAQHADDQHQIEALQKQIARNSQEIAEHQKSNAYLSSTVASLTKSVSEYQNSVSVYQKENEGLVTRLNAMEARATHSEQMFTALQNSSSEKEKKLNEIITDLYQKVLTAETEQHLLKSYLQTSQVNADQQAASTSYTVQYLQDLVYQKEATIAYLKAEVSDRTAQVAALVENSNVISSQLKYAADAIPQQFYKSNLVDEINAIVATYSEKEHALEDSYTQLAYSQMLSGKEHEHVKCLTNSITELQYISVSSITYCLEKICALQPKIYACDTKLYQCKSAISQMSQKYSVYDENAKKYISDYEEQNKNLYTYLQRANDHIQMLTKRLEALNAQIVHLEADKYSAQDEQEKLRTLNNTMSSASANYTKNVQDLQDTIRDLYDKLFNLNTEAQNLQIDKRSAEERFNNYQVLLKSQETSIGELKTQLEQSSAQHTLVLDQKIQLEKEKLQLVIRTNELQSQLDLANADAGNVKKMYDELNSKYSQLNTQYQSVIEQQKFCQNQDDIQYISYQEYEKQFSAKIESLESQLKCQTDINALLQKQVQSQIEDITTLTKPKKYRSASSLKKSGIHQKDTQSEQSEKDQQISILHKIVMNYKQLNEYLTKVLKQKYNDIEGLYFFINRLSGSKKAQNSTASEK